MKANHLRYSPEVRRILSTQRRDALCQWLLPIAKPIARFATALAITFALGWAAGSGF
jgi:hypothetical protein